MMNETLSPDRLAAEGKSAYENGDFRGAGRAYAAAADGYASAGDALSAAEMANNRSVALLRAGNARGALQAVDGTETVFAAGGDKRRQAMALSNRGAALEALGRSQVAIAAYQQAADLFKEIGEHELRASLMQSLAALHLRKGDRLQGLGALRSGLEERPDPNARQSLIKRLLRMLFRLLGIKG